MKYIIVVGDGMADYPLDELGGKTPLQVAKKPHMDWIASHGRNGLLRNIPSGMNPGSDIAIMSILGYNPRRYRRGRGPLEAAGLGVELGRRDVAFRCNLITEEDGKIADYRAGHVTTEEARELLGAIREKYGHLGDFYVGITYRHLFVIRNAPKGLGRLRTVPPHEIVGERVSDNLVKPERNEIAKTLNGMILGSKRILSDHPVNIARVESGKRPANMIWIWGHGKKPRMEPLVEKYGIRGAIISAVNVVKGVGACAGMSRFEVPGATGFYDTNYENKAKFALKALEDHDLVLVHVEAPDEAGHAGDIEEKIKAIENIDSRLIGKMIDGLEGDYVIAVTADHGTPISVRVHVADPVPVAVYSTVGRGDGVRQFNEFSARQGSFGILDGYRLMGKLLRPSDAPRRGE